MYNEREYHSQQIKRAERAAKIARIQAAGVILLEALPFILFCAACFYISPFNR